MTEAVTSAIRQFASRDEIARANALAAYIHEAKSQPWTLAGSWEEPYWERSGYFVKQEFAPRGSLQTVIPRDQWLDPAFIDLAKAFVKLQHVANPKLGRSGHIKRLQTLRHLEVALLDLKGTANPLEIDLGVLDAAAALAKKNLGSSSSHKVGTELAIFARVMARIGVCPATAEHWSNPNKQAKNVSFDLDRSAELARQKRLPDHEAIYALADIFNRDLDTSDPRVQMDIVTTSACALLMSAPSRGQEILRLPVNLVIEETDKFGQEQMGLRLHASKGFGAYVKWVWSGMAPVAAKAIERLVAMGSEARKLARHLENPATCGRFYRHSECPSVPDDRLLTRDEVCQALGIGQNNPTSALVGRSLSAANGTYTLQSLWEGYVLPEHRKRCPYFPYVSAADRALGQKGGLKFSEALFCVLRHQLSQNALTSPVLLSIPNLARLGFDLSPSDDRVTIFGRYGFTDADGDALKITSHQFRHLLNTEAQRSGLSDEQIAHWSGRLRVSQNSAYDGQENEERVEKSRAVVEAVQASIGLKPGSGDHWVVVVPHLRSATDITDIQPKLSGLKTLYGECHHDWAFAPCEGFVACLDCNEHACIKGSDEDAQTKLGRLRKLHASVQLEVVKAEAEASANIDGQEWLDVQTRYAAKVAQLISILESEDVPDGSVVRSANGQHPTHLHRALRGLAVQALQAGTGSRAVMQDMLISLESGLARIDPPARPPWIQG